MKNLLQNLEALSIANGTSGDEEAVKELIYNEIKDYSSCSFSFDNAGNLIVKKKGEKAPKNRLMFSAHMDEVGFIITHIDEKGFLRFETVGGIDTRVIIGKRVLVGKTGLPGLIGSKALHLVENDDLKNPPKIEDLFIDIGADSLDEAKKLVALGDRAVYDSDFCLFGNDVVLGKALDDRAGCAMLIELLKEPAKYDFTVCFTTREEVGGNGAPAAAFSVEPDIAVVVESTTAGDVAHVPEDKFVCCQGAGPVVSFMDKGTVYDLELYRFVTELAEKNGIPCQTKHGVYGGNDSKQIHKTRGGIRPVALSLPARYIHSPAAAVKLCDIENSVLLLKKMSTELSEL